MQEQYPNSACALIPGCCCGVATVVLLAAGSLPGWEAFGKVAESKLSLERGFLCGVTRAGSVIALPPLSISPFASQKTSFWHGSSCWCLLACLSRWGTHLPGSPHYAACSGAQWQRLSPRWKLPLPAPSLQNEHCWAWPLHCGGAFLLLVSDHPKEQCCGPSVSQLFLLPRELAKAVVMSWVLLYRHAVLWASAAVGFSNVGKAAPRAGSSLVQGSSPCMAIKCHSSWGSVLLSGLVRAFDSCLLMGRSESIPESVLWFSVDCLLLYLRCLPFVSMWVFFCPVFLLQLSRPLHWRFQHLGSLVTPSVRRVFSLTEQCKPQFKSKAVRCSSCLQAWSCCLVLIQGLETEMINLQYIKINSFFSGLFLQHRGGF